MKRGYFMTISALIALVPIIMFSITAMTETPTNPESEKLSKSAMIVNDLSENVELAEDLAKFEKAVNIFSAKLGSNVVTETTDLTSENKIKVKMASGGVTSYFEKELSLDAEFTSGWIIPMDGKQQDPMTAYRLIELALSEDVVYYFPSTCKSLDTAEYTGLYCSGFFLAPSTTDIAAIKLANPETSLVTVHTLSSTFTAENYRELTRSFKTAWLGEDYPEALEESKMTYYNVTVSDVNSTSTSSSNYLLQNGYTVLILSESVVNSTTPFLAEEIYEFVRYNGTVYAGGVSANWLLKHNS